MYNTAFNKVSPTFLEEIQTGAGFLCKSFNPATREYSGVLGVTTGGHTFDSKPAYEDYGSDLDNIPENTWQLKRVKGYDPTMSGTFKSFAPGDIVTLGAAMDVDASDSTHFIPRDELKASDFSDIWGVYDYSDKNRGAATAGLVAIHLRNAMNVLGFRLKSNKDGKGDIAFEFHGHYDLFNLEQMPFEVYCAKGTDPALASLTVTSEAGTSTGKSKITATGYTLGVNEGLVYQTAESTAPSVAYLDDVSNWTALTSGSEITPTSGHTKITVAAKNASGQAVASGTATLTVAS